MVLTFVIDGVDLINVRRTGTNLVLWVS